MYKVIRTDTAESLLRSIILYVAKEFGSDAALEKLDYLEKSIMAMERNPYIGVVPKYNILRRQGYLVLILKKDLVFYKVDDEKKVVTVYAIVDPRLDYLDIIRGL